jgi:hypothetical protein
VVHESAWKDEARLKGKRMSVKTIKRAQRAKLTKASCVDLVRKRNNGRQGQEEQQEVTEQEITAPEREFDNLDNILASRLGHGVVTETTSIPLTSPPCAVRLVMLELARDKDGDQDLLDRTLNGDDRDQTKDRMSRVPSLEEPLEQQNQ